MKDADIINGLILSTGKTKYTVSDLVYLCAPFSISETNIRTFLSRGIKNEYFNVRREDQKSYYSLSKKMNRISSNVARSFRVPDWSAWDDSWWGIIFSIPEKEKPRRHKIRKKLTFYRFAPLSGGFWVRPCLDEEKMEETLEEIRSDSGCRMIRFQYLESFDAGAAGELWNLEKINRSFRECIIRIKEKEEKLFELNPEKALKERISLGNEIIPVLAMDPLLPTSLLPKDWLGLEVRDEYFNCDRQLKEKSKPYLDKILD